MKIKIINYSFIAGSDECHNFFMAQLQAGRIITEAGLDITPGEYEVKPWRDVCYMIDGPRFIYDLLALSNGYTIHGYYITDGTPAPFAHGYNTPGVIRAAYDVLSSAGTVSQLQAATRRAVKQPNVSLAVRDFMRKGYINSIPGKQTAMPEAVHAVLMGESVTEAATRHGVHMSGLSPASRKERARLGELPRSFMADLPGAARAVLAGMGEAEAATAYHVAPVRLEYAVAAIRRALVEWS